MRLEHHRDGDEEDGGDNSSAALNTKLSRTHTSSCLSFTPFGVFLPFFIRKARVASSNGIFLFGSGLVGGGEAESDVVERAQGVFLMGCVGEKMKIRQKLFLLLAAQIQKIGIRKLSHIGVRIMARATIDF